MNYELLIKSYVDLLIDIPTYLNVVLQIKQSFI